MLNAAGAEDCGSRHFVSSQTGGLRQELNAELLSDTPGALWQLARLDRDRVTEAPELRRIVVAIDPAVSNNEGSDETGIFVAGVAADKKMYVLEDLSDALLLRIQPKHFELTAPFRRSITQPLDVDASRQAALHGSADQPGSKKGERDGHVDMTDAASLAQGSLLSVSDGSRDRLVQPASALRDGADQTEASFRPLWPDLASRCAMR